MLMKTINICAFLLILSFLFSCSQNAEEQAMLMELQNTLDKGIVVLGQELIDSKKLIHHELGDVSKKAYAPIWTEVKYMDNCFKANYDSILHLKQLEHLEAKHFVKLSDMLLATKDSLIASYEQLLQQYGKAPLGLREDEQEQLILKNMRILSEFDSISSVINSGLFEKYKPILLDKFLFDLKRLETELIYHMSYFVFGRRGCGWFNFWPNITPMQNTIQKGDVFRASINLLPDDPKFRPLDIELSVDGKKIEFEGRFAEYVSAPIWEEEKIIHLSCTSNNSLTGESYALFENLEYRIKTSK